MTVIVAYQVFMRYVVNASPSWTEGGSIMIMSWFIFLGAAVGVRENFHMGFDVLLYVLPADPAEVGISVDGLVGALTTAVESGRITEQRLDEAVGRVLTLRRSIAVDAADAADGETDSGTGE